MKQTFETGIPDIYLSQLEKLLQKIRITTEEDVEISFEFIIASLFPTSWTNIQNALSEQYTRGYIQGMHDKENGLCTAHIEDDDPGCYCE